MNRWPAFIFSCAILAGSLSGSAAADTDSSLPAIRDKSFQLLAEKAEDPVTDHGEVWRFQNPGTVVFAAPSGADLLEARFSILPGIEVDLAKNPVVQIAGAEITFALIREPEVSNLTVLVRGGSGQPWQKTDIFYKLDTHEYPESWVEVSLRIDFRSRTCDLIHRDRLWLAGIPLEASHDSTSIAMGSLKQTYLRSFEVISTGDI